MLTILSFVFDIRIMFLEDIIMKKYLLPGLTIVLGLLIAFAPFGYAEVCGPMRDGGWMKCHWMGLAVRLLGGVIAVFGLISGFSKRSRFGLAFANLVLGHAVIFLPMEVIGTCKSITMPCNVYTKPTLTLLGLILIIVNAVYIFMNRKPKEK